VREDVVGVPLMVIVPNVALPVKLILKPAGKSVAVPIPVAPVVEMVILVDSDDPIQAEGFVDAEPAVMFGLTVIVPVALTIPQPPVNGML
jgi:hypothetical protein